MFLKITQLKLFSFDGKEVKPAGKAADLDALADALAKAITAGGYQVASMVVGAYACKRWKELAIYLHGESPEEAAARAERLRVSLECGVRGTEFKEPARPLLWGFHWKESAAQKVQHDQWMMTCPLRSILYFRN